MHGIVHCKICRPDLIKFNSMSDLIEKVKYLNGFRIKKALDLLYNTDTNTINIALLCGFESISTFYDIFRN